VKVIWTPEAQAHLDGIYQYVKRDAPFYAQGVVDKLTREKKVTPISQPPSTGNTK
jgi:plasmid stabilization system protein ParE